MTTFVIVPGAFGGSWEWRQVAALLRARGCEVFTPSLTGHAVCVHLATPETGLETHILDILNLLRYEDLHEVVLAGQSYGGMVITGVADLLSPAIRGSGPGTRRWLARAASVVRGRSAHRHLRPRALRRLAAAHVQRADPPHSVSR